jgi:proteasome lid subunit RPN8/RPN11
MRRPPRPSRVAPSAMADAQDMTDDLVHRRRPLPEAPARGRLIVTEATLHETATALRAFRGRHGRHEGIVFWAGRLCGNDTLVAAALLPRAEHGPGFVRVSHAEVGWMARSARRLGLAVMAQVHSHPGSDTRHSDGDDELIVLPREGMFSLVVGRYGDGSVDPRQGAGLHQFQDEHWVRVMPAEDAFITVTAAIRP